MSAESRARRGPVRWWRRLTRRERRAVVITASVVVVVALAFAALAATGITSWLSAPPAAAPLPSATATPDPRPLYVDPAMQSRAAAAEDARFDVLAETPQGKWFTDWSTSASAEEDAATYVDAAEAAREVPVLVLYRIPARDCGAWASGGADDADEYRAWVEGIARGVTGHPDAMVVVEPDALPQLEDCDQGDRTALLRDAVDALAATGARVYIDAGHSDWLSPADAAERLIDAGIAGVRGFSLNVSNFRTTADETTFAERVRAELAARGVGEVHYVIDTGRNGAGPQGDDRCNPPGARLGAPPQLFTGAPLDAYLWVKNPGETDGACKGGPKAGFWPPAALSLLGLDSPLG